MLAEPVKEMIIEDDDAMVADADTELLIATAGTDDETKKLVGKFNVTVPPAVGDTSPPAVVLKENVTAEPYLPYARSVAAILNRSN